MELESYNKDETALVVPNFEKKSDMIALGWTYVFTSAEVNKDTFSSRHIKKLKNIIFFDSNKYSIHETELSWKTGKEINLIWL